MDLGLVVSIYVDIIDFFNKKIIVLVGVFMGNVYCSGIGGLVVFLNSFVKDDAC